MSTFKGIIAEIPGISVDQFQNENHNSRAFFVSHCHTDHIRGIETIKFLKLLKDNEKAKIYTSGVTQIILNANFPLLSSHIVGLNTEG